MMSRVDLNELGVAAKNFIQFGLILELKVS